METEYIWRLLKFAKARKRYWTGFFGKCILRGISPILAALIFKKIVDTIELKSLHDLLHSIILITLYGLAEFFLAPWLNYLYQYEVKRMILHLKLKIFRQLLMLPAKYFDKTHTGQIVTRLTNDINVVEGVFSHHLYTLVHCIIIGCFSLAFMLFMDGRITLLLLTVSFLSLFFVRMLSQPLGGIFEKIQQAQGNAIERLLNILAGYRVIRLFHLQAITSRKYIEACDAVRSQSIALTKKNSLIGSTNAFVEIISTSGTIVLGTYFAIKGQANLGSLLVIVILMDWVNYMFFHLIQFYNDMKRSNNAASRVYEILDEEREGKQSTILSINEANEYALQLKEVDFSYGGASNNVLRNICINIPKDKITALVGPSGCGKSTLLKILIGEYHQEHGMITVNVGNHNGILSNRSLRQLIAIVPQNTYLFNGSIEENIRCGNQKATYEHVVEAAKLANIHSFISSLPDGYQSVVGERGSALSGGQKQLIAIARALIKNAPILLLDEPTSSLDGESDALIVNTLTKLKEGRTIIIASHRLAPIQNADHIYFLHNGEVAGSGTHHTLLTGNNTYKQMYSKIEPNKNGKL